MAGRVVTTSRWVYFKLFDENRFVFGEWICRQGREDFCKINILTYPRWVREFYRNLSSISNGISSTVKGIGITPSDATLGQNLSILSKGIVTDRLVDQKIGLICILDRLDIGGKGEFMSNTLSTKMMLLHHIV